MCEIKVRVGAPAVTASKAVGAAPRRISPSAPALVSGYPAEAYEIPESRVVFLVQRVGGDSVAFNALRPPQIGSGGRPDRGSLPP